RSSVCSTLPEAVSQIFAAPPQLAVAASLLSGEYVAPNTWPRSSSQQLFPNSPQERRRPIAAVDAERFAQALGEALGLGSRAWTESLGDRCPTVLPRRLVHKAER